MIILGEFLAGETVKYSEVFHDDDNTPADPTSPSARLLKPDDSASSLTTPAKVDSKTGWYGGSVDTTGFSTGTHRIYMTGTVSEHSVSMAFEFEIVVSISVGTPSTRKYSGVFHADDNTPADPTSPSARILKPDGTLADLTTPAKLDTKTGWYGGSINAAAFSAGCHQVYMAGTVSEHVVAAVYHFQVRAAATLPGTPEMTDLTAGDTEVVVASTADDESDVVYARYRLPDGDWAAESETFKRTGSGNITITGLTNGQRYQIGIYAKSGDLTSDWDFGWARPTDGSNDPAGMISLPLHYLRKMVSESTAFQDWVEAADASEALARIYAVSTDTFTLPFAVVDWADNYRRAFVAGGARHHFMNEGDLVLVFWGAINSEHDDATAAYVFLNKVGAIIEDLEDLAGTGGYLGITGISIMEGPHRAGSSEKKVQGEFYEAVYRVEYR